MEGAVWEKYIDWEVFYLNFDFESGNQENKKTLGTCDMSALS
jgi:hypothetical protein